MEIEASQNSNPLTIYGLSFNPFSKSVAPDYGDSTWCFANITTEKEDHVEDLVKSIINRIVQEAPGKRGVLIVGHWGTGKTHLLIYILGRSRESGLNCDKKSIGEIRQRFQNQKIDSKTLMKEIFGEENLDNYIKILNNENKVIGVDEGQFVDEILSRHELINFMEGLRLLIENLERKRSKSLIILCVLPGTVRKITSENTRPDIIDRFELIKLRDSLTKEDAIELIKAHLETARDKDWEKRISPELMSSIEDKSLYPFKADSVEAFFDFMPDGRARYFLNDLASRVLEESARLKLQQIEKHHVTKILDKNYELYREFLRRFNLIMSEKHGKKAVIQKILKEGVYQALKIADRYTKEVGVDGVYKDIKLGPEIEISEGVIQPSKVKIDIMVRKGDSDIAIEIESKSISEKRYRNVLKIIREVKDRNVKGLLILCTERIPNAKLDKVGYIASGLNVKLSYIKLGLREEDIRNVITTGKIISCSILGDNSFDIFNDLLEKDIKKKISEDDEGITRALDMLGLEKELKRFL